jgi:transcriptional regulator with XRE-family HTH domain
MILQEFFHRTGIARGTLSPIFSVPENANPSLQMLCRIAVGLNVKIQVRLCGAVVAPETGDGSNS